MGLSSSNQIIIVGVRLRVQRYPGKSLPYFWQVRQGYLISSVWIIASQRAQVRAEGAGCFLVQRGNQVLQVSGKIAVEILWFLPVHAFVSR